MGRALGEESLRDERPDVLRDVLLRDPDGVREAGLGDVGRDAVLRVLRPVLREVDEDPLSDGQPHGQIPHATKEWTSWVQMNFVGFLRSACALPCAADRARTGPWRFLVRLSMIPWTPWSGPRPSWTSRPRSRSRTVSPGSPPPRPSPRRSPS